MKPLPAAVFLGLAMQAVTASADVGGKYAAACATCHAGGALGAPRKGDAAAWAPRLAQGMPVLVQHVRNGFRNMPAKGLCNDCDDADYEALIKFMSQ